ncbi:MAG: hypothetical protein FD127_141 [Acidimicrobiaceae bacterium]|nr:MAG: hypothetical protein FD127_141 [Acidimicrobiaceae bacterium]
MIRQSLEAHRRRREHRQDQHHGEQQLPAHRAHHHECDQEQQAGAHELEQAPLDELPHALDVGGHPANQHAGLVAIEERHRLSLHPVEHPEPKLAQEAFPRRVDREVLLPADQVVDDHHDDVDGDAGVEHRRVPGLDAAIGRHRHEHRPGHGAQRGRHDERHRRPDLPAVGMGELERPAQHRSGLGAIEPVLVADRARGPHRQPTT